MPTIRLSNYSMAFQVHRFFSANFLAILWFFSSFGCCQITVMPKYIMALQGHLILFSAIKCNFSYALVMQNHCNSKIHYGYCKTPIFSAIYKPFFKYLVMSKIHYGSCSSPTDLVSINVIAILQ